MSSSPFAPSSITPLISATNGLMPVPKSAVIASVINIATVNGNNDLFVVPQGKRAMLSATIYNQSGGALTYTPQVKINGVYIQYFGPLTANNNTGVVLLPFNTTMVAEAGETISINCSGIMQLFGSILLFDATDGILTPKLTTFQTGDNTIYTCPPGKYAYMTNFSNAGNSIIRTFNNSGATRTYKIRCVPFGVAPSDTYLVTASFTTANGVVTNTTIAGMLSMKPGDYININVDAGTAAQFAYIVNLVEQFIP
jgi:hypothetical protein